jgi:hypothetical protein
MPVTPEEKTERALCTLADWAFECRDLLEAKPAVRVESLDVLLRPGVLRRRRDERER